MAYLRNGTIDRSWKKGFWMTSVAWHVLWAVAIGDRPLMLVSLEAGGFGSHWW